MAMIALILVIGFLNLSPVLGAPVAENMTDVSEPNGNTQTTSDGVSIDAASEYLIKFGYQNKSESRLAPSPESLSLAIANFQRFAGLNVTGVLDESTLALMATPRCQVPDQTSSGNRYVLTRTKWTSTTLSYKILNQPTNTINIPSTNGIPSIISTSLNDWAKVSPLQFNPTASNPNINIGFYAYNHGDGESFDGRNGVLAHAFFPRDGRLHFDDSETWSDGVGSGTNFRQVATHELGHILGLAHSTVRNAVMYPYYTSYKPNFALDNDDIQGIQALYGSNPGPIPTVSTTLAPRPPITQSTRLPDTTTKKGCNGFYCVLINICIPSSWVCDRDNDCQDNSDEANCQNIPTKLTQAPAQQTVTPRPIYPTRFRRTTRNFFYNWN